MGSVLSLSSFVFQSGHDLRSLAYGKLILLTLTCSLENVNCSAFFCNSAKQYSVQLCRKVLNALFNDHTNDQHSQLKPQIPEVRGPRPLACSVLDCMILFMNHNQSKKLQTDMYLRALSNVQLVILSLKRNHMRLTYHWHVLYMSLLKLIRFMITHPDIMATRPQADTVLDSVRLIYYSHLTWQAVNVLNYIITHGDSFLPDTSSYDYCYYEIIRNNDLFQQVFMSFWRWLKIIAARILWKQTKHWSITQIITKRRSHQHTGYMHPLSTKVARIWKIAVDSVARGCVGCTSETLWYVGVESFITSQHTHSRVHGKSGTVFILPSTVQSCVLWPTMPCAGWT